MAGEQPCKESFGVLSGSSSPGASGARRANTDGQGKTQMVKKGGYPSVFTVLCPVLDSTIGKGCSGT